MRSWQPWIVGAVLAPLACQSGASYDEGPPTAHSVLVPRSRDNDLRGVALFVEEEEGLRVTVDLLRAPDGVHAVHLHKIGDCSAWDARSTGSHFNPDRKPHGPPGSPDSHAGDLGNIEVRNGSGRLEFVSALLTVQPGLYSVVGRSIVVHEYEDDFVTQPEGNSGMRIACGEIELRQN